MQLGYTKPHLGDLDPIFFSLSKALEVAGTEAQRGKRFEIRLNPDENGGQNEDGEPGRFHFDYPVVQYPEAYTLLVQYPLHTYLLFSVDRSVGGEGRTADSRFQSFSDFIDKELGAVKENDQLGKLAESLNQAVVKRKQLRTVFKKVASLPDDRESAKVCLLWQQLSNPAGSETVDSNLLLDREIYNEIYHISGEFWTESSEVIQYLNDQQCIVNTDRPDNITCSCN
jgi:hypothetical protein